jgi:hypothetical protein
MRPRFAKRGDGTCVAILDRLTEGDCEALGDLERVKPGHLVLCSSVLILKWATAPADDRPKSTCHWPKES